MFFVFEQRHKVVLQDLHVELKTKLLNQIQLLVARGVHHVGCHRNFAQVIQKTHEQFENAEGLCNRSWACLLNLSLKVQVVSIHRQLVVWELGQINSNQRYFLGEQVQIKVKLANYIDCKVAFQKNKSFDLVVIDLELVQQQGSEFLSIEVSLVNLLLLQNQQEN